MIVKEVETILVAAVRRRRWRWYPEAPVTATVQAGALLAAMASSNWCHSFVKTGCRSSWCTTQSLLHGGAVTGGGGFATFRGTPRAKRRATVRPNTPPRRSPPVVWAEGPFSSGWTAVPGPNRTAHRRSPAHFEVPPLHVAPRAPHGPAEGPHLGQNMLPRASPPLRRPPAPPGRVWRPF